MGCRFAWWIYVVSEPIQKAENGSATFSKIP